MSPLSKEDKLRVLNNDRRVATTYYEIAQIDELGGGRFKQEPRVPEYPRQPANSPWSQPDPNVEPPLGFSVDAQDS